MSKNLDRIISTLEDLARKHPEVQGTIGDALGIVHHYKKCKFSTRDRVTSLPDTTELFGYFIIYDCTEVGDLISPVTDKHGNPLEFLPESKVVEQI